VWLQISRFATLTQAAARLSWYRCKCRFAPSAMATESLPLIFVPYITSLGLYLKFASRLSSIILTGSQPFPCSWRQTHYPAAVKVAVCPPLPPTIAMAAAAAADAVARVVCIPRVIVPWCPAGCDVRCSPPNCSPVPPSTAAVLFEAALSVGVFTKLEADSFFTGDSELFTAVPWLTPLRLMLLSGMLLKLATLAALLTLETQALAELPMLPPRFLRRYLRATLTALLALPPRLPLLPRRLCWS